MKTQRVVFRSQTCDLAGVRARIREFLASVPLDEADVELIVLALDEACTNVIRHAYCHKCRPVRLTMERLVRKIRFVLRDYGTPCDPAKIRSRDLADIRPGGLGVHIIHQAFETVAYLPQKRGTRLVLERRIPAEAGRSSGL